MSIKRKVIWAKPRQGERCSGIKKKPAASKSPASPLRRSSHPIAQAKAVTVLARSGQHTTCLVVFSCPSTSGRAETIGGSFCAARPSFVYLCSPASPASRPPRPPSACLSSLAHFGLLTPTAQFPTLPAPFVCPPAKLTQRFF